MTQISSLPTTIVVQNAFNPTNIYSPTQTWTDVSAYVTKITTTMGRQHMLDRWEPGSAIVTVNNRTGFFSTANTVRTRLPIKITTTGPNASVFYGLIDEPDTKQLTAIDVELDLHCSDYLKMLSLTYMDQPTYYGQFVTGTSAVCWYRMDSLADPSLAPGTTSASASNTVVDSINGYNGTAQGQVFTSVGAMVYDTSVSCDLTAGTGNPLGVLDLTLGIANASGFVDLWVIGLNCNGSTILACEDAITGADTSLRVSADGFVTVSQTGTVTMTVKVNDGNWHHIGYGQTNTAQCHVVVDGVDYPVAGNPILFDANGASVLGSAYVLNGSTPQATYDPSFAGYMDEIVGSTSTATVVAECQARYTAGSRLGQNRGSADMVNDVLQVAGFGAFPYDVNYGTYTQGSWQGTTNVAGWASTVTNSTALDLILLVCDTEIGGFFQDATGTFQFLTRDYPYLAANLASNFTFTNFDNAYSNQAFYDGPNLQLIGDDMDLWTSVKVTPTSGTVQRFSANAATINLYGTTTLTKSTQPTTLAHALGEAQYWGFIYRAPLERVGAAMLGSETLNGAYLTYMLTSTLFERVVFVYRDPFGTVTSTPMVIESISQEFEANPGLWHTTFILDPYPADNPTPFLLWDDATHGVWDTNVWI